jgi:hypothetical protein
MERRFTNLSHQTACMEVVTPQDTAESPLRNEYPAPSTSRAEVEGFDLTSTAVLHPVTEQTTRDSRSSGRGHQATQLCPTNTRESNKSDGDVFGPYGVGNVANTQPAKLASPGPLGCPVCTCKRFRKPGRPVFNK